MTLLSGLGIILSLVFGCLLLALLAEVYYLLWWKKSNTITNTNTRIIDQHYNNHTKEMFYLFCWDKPPTSNTSLASNNNNNNNTNNSRVNNHATNPDLEAGLGSAKKSIGVDEGVEAELMRLHKLGGPPKFLFTITEETNEDLEVGNVAVSSSPQSKGTPKSVGQKGYDNCNSNPLFESSVESEMWRLRSSPPPKFKFLRDAEEKLYRMLLEEAQRSGIFQEGVLVNSHSCAPSAVEDKENGFSCETVVQRTPTV